MKYIILLFGIIIFSACSTTDDKGNKTKLGFQIVTINNCEYAIYVKVDAATMVHAGNCKNPEHTGTVTLLGTEVDGGWQNGNGLVK